MSMFVTGQIIGAVAVLFSLSLYQTNRRRMMLGLAATAALLYAISFFLIGAYTGAVLNLIGGIRCLAFMRTRCRKDSVTIYAVFALISVGGAVWTWSGPLSLLALAGTLASASASAQLRTGRMRRIGLFAPPLWLCYNLLVRSYPGIFIELFMIISNLIGQYRFDIRRGKPLKTTVSARPR